MTLRQLRERLASIGPEHDDLEVCACNDEESFDVDGITVGPTSEEDEDGELVDTGPLRVWVGLR